MDAEGFSEALDKDEVVDGVKRGRQVQEDQGADITIIHGVEVRSDVEQGSSLLCFGQ